MLNLCNICVESEIILCTYVNDVLRNAKLLHYYGNMYEKIQMKKQLGIHKLYFRTYVFVLVSYDQICKSQT